MRCGRSVGTRCHEVGASAETVNKSLRMRPDGVVGQRGAHSLTSQGRDGEDGIIIMLRERVSARRQLLIKETPAGSESRSTRTNHLNSHSRPQAFA